MNKFKIFLGAIFFLALIGSNAYWFAVWINSSLEEKALFSDIIYHQENSESYLKLVNQISAGSSRGEIEKLLKAHYSKELWANKETLNTKKFKFIFTKNELTRVEKQTEISPNDKG